MAGLARNADALARLAEQAKLTEASRSAYWAQQLESGQFDGGTLGNFSTKTGALHSLGHWALQLPFRWLAYGSRNFGVYHRIGRGIARRQGRQFTSDMLRQVLSLAHIRRRIAIEGAGPAHLVIGDGYGAMASLLLAAAPERKIITVNLNQPLLSDLRLIRLAAPEAGIALATTREEMSAALSDPAVRVVAVPADHAGAIAGTPLGVAVNIVSMQEMTAEAIAGYFRVMRSNPAGRTVFYCCNKLEKPLGDGNSSRFLDYPWRADDEVLIDGLCRWSHLYYSKEFPFWHYRRGAHRIIWHRLALLQSDAA
jgi:hypothetical protein